MVFERDGNPLLVKDDFSKDGGHQWIFLGAAKRDSNEEYVVLTEPGSQLVGVIWLKNNLTFPFTVYFQYKIGGGSGADGLVFMFYKDWDYEPGIGGFLGFLCREVEEPCPRDEAPGYGLEFDNYYNSKEAYGETYREGDPSSNHIALIKDHIGNHLTYVNDSRTEDNLWHQVKMIVNELYIIIFIDGQEALTWAGEIDRTNSHIGFGSGIWGFDNFHIIDNFMIYGNTITVKGLQQGWVVEFLGENGLFGKTVVPNGNTTAILDVSELEMPLKGFFKVYDNAELVFESILINEVWGGDIWSVRSKNPTEEPLQRDEQIWDLEYILLVMGITVLLLMTGFFIYRGMIRRNIIT